MSKIDWKVIYKKTTGIAWALFFLTLPVTSFPYFPSGTGGMTLVRPMAVYPMAALLVLLIIPRLFMKPLPRTFLPLFAFILVALISSVFAFTSDLDGYRGVTQISRLVRNLTTLGIGVAFYFTTHLVHERWGDLRASLRWLYAGFAVALFWGTVQIPNIILGWPKYYRLTNSLQKYISIRKLFPTRISGMTYEPKWFAEQICFLLLPWLITSVLTRQSSFSWRWRGITVEWLLLIWSVAVLPFTFSRTGIFLLVLLVIVGYLMRAYLSRKDMDRPKKPLRRRVLEFSSIFLVIIAALVAVGSQNAYFSRLWRYWTEAKSRNKTYFEFISVAQRFVYWETALNIFSEDPWLGVGLGNYAFYFKDNLPKRPFNQQVEIVRQITPVESRDRLITPKNMVARLVAETGAIGAGAFLTFILAVVGCTAYLWHSPSAEQQFWGLAGSLVLIIFFFLVFSFDSFALPNMWIVFGLITAAAHLPDPLPSSTQIKALPE